MIGQQHFGPYLETQNYAWYVAEISVTISAFVIDYFQEELAWKNFSKNPSNPILGSFWAFLPKFGTVWTNLSVFQYSNYLPLCQKSEKPNEIFLRELLDGHTKDRFIALISLWDTANFRVLRLIEKSRNRSDQEHFGPYLRNQNFPKYETCSSLQELQ